MSPADRAVAGGLRRGLAHRDPEGGGRGGWVWPPAGRGARPGGGGLLLLEGEHEAGKCPDVIITSLCCQAPEGDEVALTYTAGEAGYLAEGAALPLSPAVPEAPAVELPVMMDLTPEVAEARDAFMATFEEVKMRAEAMEAEAEPEPEAVESMERRRRDTEEAMVMEAAEMEDQVAMEDMAVEAVEGAAKFQVPPTLPRYLHYTYLQYLHISAMSMPQVPVFPVSYYAPSYPHYYLPTVQQKVAGAEAEEAPQVAQTVPYLPSILPSYQYYPFSSYIPRVVQPVQVSTILFPLCRRQNI